MLGRNFSQVSTKARNTRAKRKASRRERTGSSRAKRFPKTLLPPSPGAGRQRQRFRRPALPIAGARRRAGWSSLRATAQYRVDRLISRMLREGSGSVYIEIGPEPDK